MSAMWLALGSVMASAAGQLFLSAGARAPRPVASGLVGWIALLTDPRTVVGLICWAASAVLWMATLQRERLSHVYALASLNYVLVPLGARLVFGERLGGMRLAGMLVIVAGVGLCVAARGPEGPTP